MTGVLLATRIRTDEKLLLEAFSRRKIVCDVLDLRQATFRLDLPHQAVQFAVNRSIGQTEGLSATCYFESRSVPVINCSAVIECCGDKARMTQAFSAHNLPFPATAICYSSESALTAARELGFPVVLKPTIGSWGRMVVKIDDVSSARAVFAYKEGLTSLHHKVFYIQKYVEKPGRDIRVIVINGRAVAQYYRYAEDWVTNVRLGAKGVPAVLAVETVELAIAAAAACGGGAVSVDLMEGPDGRVLVNEVNHTMEFTEASKATGIDIADHYAAFCELMAA